MIINRLTSSLKLFYKIFITSPKQWRLLKKSEILIYDEKGVEYLLPYLKDYSVVSMAVRGESINVPCLLRSALTLKFWKGKPLNTYAETYIRAVAPKVVITFIDNNGGFYCISKRFPDIKTIFLQNGTRGEYGDIFYSLIKSDNYHVDYMLVAGSAIGRHYQKFLSGQFISVGSLKNNAVNNSSGVAGDAVLFISQWHNKPDGGAPFYIEQDGSPINWDQFYAAEVKVLKFLDKWCVGNNKILEICGRGRDKNGPERNFFADCLKDCVWKYIPRMDNYSAYKLVDTAQIVVFIDSTLGYEAFGRGKKTASFSCRMIGPNMKYYKFGWPAGLPNNGPFWTNDQDEAQFQRVLDYLNTVSDKEWEETRRCYAADLMEYDPGNTRFVKLLQQLLPKTGVVGHVQQ